MTFTPDMLMLYIIALPVLGSVLIALAGEKRRNLREAFTLVTAGVTFALLIPLAQAVMNGARPALSVAEPLPGVQLALSLEPLGMLFALVAGFLWIVTSIYAIGYMRGHNEQHQTRFYICFALAISFAMGVAFSANLLTLFVFYEMLTLSTYPLVTHAGTDKARRAGRVYLGILLGTSICFLLLAILGTWHLTGSVTFQPGGILAGTSSPLVLSALLLLFFFGVGKAALMPFHRWLPAAMVAPTPVSALLHAVAVVKAGVFTLMKIAVYIFGTDLLPTLPATEFLLYVAGATIILSSLVAMTKDNLKARLAYSTVGQLSYITLGALLATSAGITGGSMHIAMHAFGKITLFFCAGAIMVAAHKTEISQMRGLGRAMPLTMMAFVIGSLSIIGVPVGGGTWSKWYLALGTVETGHWILLGVLMLSSLLSIAYLLIIPVRAFFTPQADNTATTGMQEAPLPCLIAIGVATIGCVALFLYPAPLFELTQAIGN